MTQRPSCLSVTGMGVGGEDMVDPCHGFAGLMAFLVLDTDTLW